MSQLLENKPELGYGIYTTPDIAQILRLPYGKVHRWIKDYWDNNFAKEVNSRYSWTDGKAIAISFHTLVEIFTFYQFTHAGVTVDKIITSHKILSKKFDTPFPFATSDVLINISTDGKRIYFLENGKDIISLDASHQLNLDLVRQYFKKIEFDGGSLAVRLWPIGKDKSVVVDPSHQFGQAVIKGTNISPETLFELHEAGEPDDFIASLYGVSNKQVQDALDYCRKAA
jgi:uncharacterized protein (DUF433 family)